MTAIPRAALGLGLAGLLPFLWGAVTHLSPSFGAASGLLPKYLGAYVSITYGMVILSFMSGVLWGFATKASGARAAAGYALSVLPALWAFFMTNTTPADSALNLMAGFAGLLGLDVMFARWGLAPAWWIRLRVLLTAIVLACLGAVAFA